MNTKSIILSVFPAAILLIFSGIAASRASCDNLRETPVVQVVRQNAAAGVIVDKEGLVVTNAHAVGPQEPEDFPVRL